VSTTTALHTDYVTDNGRLIFQIVTLVPKDSTLVHARVRPPNFPPGDRESRGRACGTRVD